MNKYSKERLIGKGTYGQVWLVKLNRSYYVMKEIKIVSTKAPEKQHHFNEVTVLSKCKHRNIILYKEAAIDHTTGLLSIVMEYAESGDLSKAITKQRNQKGPFPESKIIGWFIQICLALQYIHSKNILHRDLKPQNIFLCSDDTIKVGDFGIARLLETSDDFATTGVGTPYYLSPEIILRKPYNSKSDMWALGCILFEMSALQHPFEADNWPQLMDLILKGNQKQFPNWSSDLIKQKVEGLLSLDPAKRPSTDEVLSCPMILPHLAKYVSTTKENSTRHLQINSTAYKKPSSCLKRSASSASNTSSNVLKLRKNTPISADDKRKPRSASAAATPPFMTNLVKTPTREKFLNNPRSENKADLNITYMVQKTCTESKASIRDSPDTDGGYLSEEVNGNADSSGCKSATANQLITGNNSLTRSNIGWKKGLEQSHELSHCNHSQCHQCMIDMLWKNRIRGSIKGNNNDYLKLKKKLLLVFKIDLFEKIYESLLCDWEKKESQSPPSIQSFLKSLNYEQVQHLPLMVQLIQLDLQRPQAGLPANKLVIL